MIDNIQINRIARNPNGALWPGWSIHTSPYIISYMTAPRHHQSTVLSYGCFRNTSGARYWNTTTPITQLLQINNMARSLASQRTQVLEFVVWNLTCSKTVISTDSTYTMVLHVIRIPVNTCIWSITICGTSNLLLKIAVLKIVWRLITEK